MHIINKYNSVISREILKKYALVGFSKATNILRSLKNNSLVRVFQEIMLLPVPKAHWD